jgi:putative ABC transport system permease protein
MGKDFKFAIRILRKNAGFTAVAIASLVLGIGANTAIFSFVNAILLTQLHVPQPDRLVTFAETYRGETAGHVWKLSTVDELAKRSPVFSGVFGWFAKPISFSTGDTAHWVFGELVTAQYFETLQVKPAVGRLFTEKDVHDALTNPVCVISYGLWHREFDGDYAVVGRNVLLNGHSYGSSANLVQLVGLKRSKT